MAREILPFDHYYAANSIVEAHLIELNIPLELHESLMVPAKDAYIAEAERIGIDKPYSEDAAIAADKILLPYATRFPRWSKLAR